VVRSAQDVYGVPQLITPMSGGSGPNYPFIKVLGLPVATAGPSYPGSNAHAPNENLVIEHYVDGTRHVARILAAVADL
jgi:acetylornithine deacetylase/succinyl-diaminopimelate desuccinylase-like protein